MKKLFGAFLALCASTAFGTTTVPVQLLNPAGSSSGQAVVSTGSSSAPAWGSVNAVTLNGATFAAPGPIGSTTPSTGAFTALTGTSYNGPVGTVTPNTGGFTTLNSTGGSLNGTIGQTTAFAGSFTTISATGLITPSTTSGIKGTTAADNASAGSDGEVLTNTTTATSLASGTIAACASVSLTAGDWDVMGLVQTAPAGSTTTSFYAVGINTSSTAFQVISGGFLNISDLPVSGAAGGVIAVMAPVARINVSSTTTVFLDAQITFAVSTMACNGFIRARRVR